MDNEGAAFAEGQVLGGAEAGGTGPLSEPLPSITASVWARALAQQEAAARARLEEVERAELFSHVSTEKSPLYRAILEIFATEKRFFRYLLRPEDVYKLGAWQKLSATPNVDEVRHALDFLVQKGNLEAHPDTARYSTLDDFYRNQSIYSLSRKGEAVEAAMLVYQQGLVRRGELQAVALEDITSRLQSLILLKDAPALDVPKAHETLRDLIARFEEMTEKARDFMAEMGRALVLSGAEIQVVEKYKLQLLSYLERFLSDLVRRLDSISQLIAALEGSIQFILMEIADREARDSAPGSWEGTDFRMRYRKDWTNRWLGLKRWFVSTDQSGSEADNLRQCARNAINQLSDAVNTINDRRAGRSDRSADFVTLAGWFMGCADDAEAHCLARAAFALNPARHLPLATREQEAVPPSTSWADAPPLEINLRLYQYGDAQMRGQLPGVRDRSAERAEIARRLADESQQVEAARKRLATGKATRLSDLGPLNPEEFSAFLALLGDALDHQAGPDATVEVTTGDGQLTIRLEPLGPDTHARIETPAGVFSGRDHILTISRTRHD